MADTNDATLRLVSIAYRAAVEPERFDDLLAAWDSWLDGVITSAGQSFDAISPMFRDALEVADRLDEAQEVQSQTAFDLAPSPAVLFDADNQVLAVNAAATAFLARENTDLPALLSVAPNSFRARGHPPSSVYRLGGGPGQQSYLAVEATVSPAVQREYPAAARLVLVSRIDWTEAYSAEIATRFALSPAELRVAQALLEGLTAQEMAAALDRSLATIRSHIKVLLQKTQTRRQSELVQVLTILRVVGAMDDTGTPGRRAGDDVEILRLTGKGGVLPVVRYGAGRPVLYFTSSSRPEETAPVRSAFAKAGLQVFAPYRPGYGDAPEHSGDASDALLNGWLTELYDMCEAAPVLVGHREGGILALQAAARLQASGRKVAGVVCISTGAPKRSWRAWLSAPPSIRRSFLAARFAPVALQFGYTTAVRLFQSGKDGQGKIVDYFFVDSPTDDAKLSDPYFYNVTRDWIDYSFNNVGQVVRDIALWASDWSPVLQDVAATTPVRFIHGSDHTFFAAEDVTALTEGNVDIACQIVSGSGQLAMFDAPEHVAAEIRRVGTEADPMDRKNHQY